MILAFCLKSRQIFIRYKDANGKPRAIVVYDQDEQRCKDKAHEVRERIRNDQPPRDATAKLASVVEVWISSTLKASGIKQSTKDEYSTLARKHIRDMSLGAMRMCDLKASHIEAWLLDLTAGGLSESTIRTCYTVLRKILDAAVRDELLRTNWAAKVTRPTVTRHEAAYLDTVQVAELIRQASDSGSRYALLFELLAVTGLRRGEALALKWSDIDWDKRDIWAHGTLARLADGLVVTPPKTKTSNRHIYMGERAYAILKQLKTRQAEEHLRAGSLWQATGFVFTTETGQPCDPRNALRALKSSAEKVGLTGIGLHTLRHSAATAMLENGVPLKVVSEQLGHSSVAVTGDIYGHVTPASAMEAMKTLDAAMVF